MDSSQVADYFLSERGSHRLQASLSSNNRAEHSIGFMENISDKLKESSASEFPTRAFKPNTDFFCKEGNL